MAGAVAFGPAAGGALAQGKLAQDKFKAVTTFTVIADMARNVAGQAANADAYKRRIAEAIAPIRAKLEAIPADRRRLVTSEGAFSYLARDFGLKELYLWPISIRSLTGGAGGR